MHWRTFERLTSEYNAFAAASLTGMAAKLDLVEQRLDGIRDDLRCAMIENLFRKIAKVGTGGTAMTCCQPSYSLTVKKAIRKKPIKS